MGTAAYDAALRQARGVQVVVVRPMTEQERTIDALLTPWLEAIEHFIREERTEEAYDRVIDAFYGIPLDTLAEFSEATCAEARRNLHRNIADLEQVGGSKFVLSSVKAFVSQNQTLIEFLP